MKWRIAAVVVVLVTVGLTVSVVLGAWTGSRTSGGRVNATTVAPPDLHLCEPGGNPCGQDDIGPDELIFEGMENLVPNGFASDSLRLRNVGGQPLDVVRAVTTVTELSDPGADCNLLPSVRIGLLGPPPFFGGDNHLAQFASVEGLQAFPRALDDPRYDSFFGGEAVHIAPGEHEDFQIHLLLPGSAPSACENNAWNVSISWQVVTDVAPRF